MPNLGSKKERFFDKVYYEPNTGCWLWGASTIRGYGQFYGYAHRYSYELHKGEIPDGLVIDHLCCVPLCVNPSHLEAVTQGENLRRMYERGRGANHNSMKTCCKYGHPLSGENLVLVPGGRECRQCGRERSLAFWRKKHPMASKRGPYARLQAVS